MKVFSLPNDVMVCVLNCCSLKDLQKLDSACSTSIDRQNLLDCFQRIKCSFVELHESFWICFRKFGITGLRIGNTNAARYNSIFFRELFNHLTELKYLYVYDIDIFSFDFLTTLHISSLKKLEVLSVYKLSGDIFNDQFLMALLAFCPCLGTIALHTSHYVSLSATSVARAFSIHPLLNSFSIRWYASASGCHEISVDRNGKSIRLDCEVIDELNMCAFFSGFKSNTFEEIIFTNFYASKVDDEILFDLIARQCPQLIFLDIDYVDEHTATALRSLLHNTPSLHKLRFRNTFSEEKISDNVGFDTLFNEKLPGNVTTLTLNVLWKTLTTETVKHILAINSSIINIELNECVFIDISAVQTYVDELVARGRNLSLKVRQNLNANPVSTQWLKELVQLLQLNQ